MSDSLGDDRAAGYLNSQVDGLIMVRKNCAIRVHQEVALSGKCKLCWERSSVSRRKHDDLTSCSALDHGSLAVWALRNQTTGRGPLLTNGQPERERRSVSSQHHLRGECGHILWVHFFRHEQQHHVNELTHEPFVHLVGVDHDGVRV